MIDGLKLCAFADEAGSSLAEQINALTENGITQIELRGVNGKNVSKLCEAELKDIKKRLDEAGVSVWSIGSPAGKTPIQNDFYFEIEQMKRLSEAAYITKASCIRIFSFYGTEGRDEYFDEIISRLLRFSEISEGCGAVLCHENEKGIYGDIPQRCFEIHKALPQIKNVFDPANYVQCGVNTIDAWRLLAQFTHYLHIKDASADGSIVPAGHGVGNVGEIVKAFSDMGGGTLTLEPHLTVFEGLSALEEDKSLGKSRQSKVGGMSFPSKRAAFDAAVTALRMIID